MKLLFKAAFILLLLFPPTYEALARNDRSNTIKEQMKVMHEHFGVNFIYDSSISVDVPSEKACSPGKMSLEECLETVFGNSGLEWEIHRKYIVLTRKDDRRRPDDYTIFIEEQKDTIDECIFTALTARDRNTTQTGFKRIDRKSFDTGYSLLSSPDVIKTLQQQPGVAGGTELLSGLYVRGGDGADNLYLMDGVPIYQTSHLLGLFSSFNTDVTESVDFYKSGFPARYGGRLSSVIDVRTREGDFNEYHGSFSIGLLDGRLQFEGPVVKEKTSFNIGLRRSWMDAITEPASLIIRKINGNDFRLKYAFRDFNANVTHRFSDASILSFNLYGGKDDAKYNRTALSLDWGNLIGSLDWDCRLSDIHELETKMYFSRYDAGFSAGSTLSRNISETSDLGLKADFSLRPGKRHHIRYGASFQHHTYHPRHYKEGKVMSDMRQTMEPSAYIEDEIIVTEDITTNVGVRYSAIVTKGKTYHDVQPRAALRFRLNDNASMNLSYSEMVQNDHQIASNYLQLPTSFWMPSTERILPSRSRQAAGGLYFSLPHNVRVNVEGYFKTMDNLLEFRGKWGIYPPIHLWEDTMVAGKGRSWGVETEVSWSDEKTSLNAFYTLSWSQRLFEDFYPDWYRDRNDNRHKITLTATRKIGRRCEVYAGWNFHSGNLITVESQALAPEDIGSWPETFYSKPNNLKLPDYHRLDIGFNFRRTTVRGNESIWNLSIYNAYCHMNPILAYLGEQYDFTKDNLYGFSFVGEAFGMIPVLPSFSYTLKF